MTRRRRAPKGVPGEEVPPVAVGDALDIVSAQLGLPEPRAMRALAAAWDDVVGPALAAHVHLRTLRDGVLVLVVDSSPWATEVRYLEPVLLERAAQIVSPAKLERIRVVVDGPAGGPKRRPPTGD